MGKHAGHAYTLAKKGARMGRHGVLQGQKKGLEPHDVFVLLLLRQVVHVVLTLISPVKYVLGWQILCGRHMWNVAKEIERRVWQTIGWLFGDAWGLRLTSPAGRLWWFQTAKRWHIVTAAVLAHIAVMSGVNLYRNSKDENVKKRQKLRRKMLESKSYYEWSINAAKLDVLNGFSDGDRRVLEEQLYDRQLLEDKLFHLRHVRETASEGSGVREQMYAVRSDLVRNLGNIANPALNEHFPIVPGPIREYIDEVRLHLDQITYSDELPLREKSAFLRETRHAFGRTALVLSGGGPLGAFHLGVVKALVDHRMLPRVLAGSQSGAIVCALIATRTDTELQLLLNNLDAVDLTFFSTATVVQKALHALAGAPQGTNLMLRRLRHLLGDLTFLEAYMHTGRVLNMSVGGSRDSSRVLNYLTAPHMLIWSAVACSSGFAGMSSSQKLLIRKADGSIVSTTGESLDNVTDSSLSEDFVFDQLWNGSHHDDELSMRRLSEMFSVNHFIVSQTTPHIAPFLSFKRKLGIAGQLLESEFKHRCRQAAELLPLWVPTGWLRRLSHPWEGDVTIVLPDTMLQIKKNILTATHADLKYVVRQGELCTWAKMSAVQCNCGIEVTLDECLNQVSNQERQDALLSRGKVCREGGKSFADLSSIAKSISSDSLNNFNGSNRIFSPDEEHLPLPEETLSPIMTKRHRVGRVEGWKNPKLPTPIYDCVDPSATLKISKPEHHDTLKSKNAHVKCSLDCIAP